MPPTPPLLPLHTQAAFQADMTAYEKKTSAGALVETAEVRFFLKFAQERDSQTAAVRVRAVALSPRIDWRSRLALIPPPRARARVRPLTLHAFVRSCIYW